MNISRHITKFCQKNNNTSDQYCNQRRTNKQLISSSKFVSRVSLLLQGKASEASFNKVAQRLSERRSRNVDLISLNGFESYKFTREKWLTYAASRVVSNISSLRHPDVTGGTGVEREKGFGRKWESEGGCAFLPLPVLPPFLRMPRRLPVHFAPPKMKDF